MPTDVIMPQMGESIFEGTITKWLKKAGDPVEKDEPLLEISTDKVDAEIPSPVAGVLTEIRITEGATVEVNTVLGVIAEAGESAVAAPADGVPADAAPADGQIAPPAASTSAFASVPVAAPQEPLPLATDRRIRSSPLVRRIAKENQLDLAQVPGTGSAGRITKEDILRFLSQRGPGSAAASAQANRFAASQPRSAPPPLSGELVPLSRMRAIIAQRMVESVQTSPHAHVVYKVDMTRVVRLREREKAGFEQRHGVKLTYMPFIAAAAIEALRRYPIVNASLEEVSGGKSIHYHANIHMGIAVALEWGLIVPVIRQAEARSFVELARVLADLAARARAKRLDPNEVGGSTFTLTNAGVFGGEFGMPIINQPESAILAIGGLRKEPAVLTDAEGNDSIAIRSMQYYCLGFDHRTIDGADAGRFMTEFSNALENWDKAIG
jgi:pyruvate dehydrogenase E2 component (dihydrolipoamide acetyltransferase)